jgi:photosystem II stability/assembly factor-like uncharacterized protein
MEVKMPRKSIVFVGTTEGGFSFEKGKTSWKKRGPFLKKESVSHYAYDKKSRTLYAATLTDGVHLSKDMGKTWKPINNGLAIRKIWTVAVSSHDSNLLFAGSHYSHLFKSENKGKSWEDVESLYKVDGRKDWGIDWTFGTIGNCIHTVLVDPVDPNRIYFVSSLGGPFRSDDGGTKWERIRNGLLDFCTLTDDKRHIEEVHTCTHRLAFAPSNSDVIYQQNHCGVYRTDSNGDYWTDISTGLPDRHGFPIAVLAKKNEESIFVTPAYQGKCDRHNSCILGDLEAYRSTDGGRNWEKRSNGLPQKVHTCVLRHGMSSNSSGVFFGTTTGEVYGTLNDGDSWDTIAKSLPRIQGVVAI